MMLLIFNDLLIDAVYDRIKASREFGARISHKPRRSSGKEKKVGDKRDDRKMGRKEATPCHKDDRYS